MCIVQKLGRGIELKNVYKVNMMYLVILAAAKEF